MERRGCDILSLVEETWQQIVETQPTESPPAFEIEMADDVPKQWFVDSSRLQQVIRNLVENAIFACQDQGPIVVGIEFHDHDSQAKQQLRLTVSDNGDGVPNEKREDIFAPFFTTKTKGTGLGLAISRRIVEAHGGTLNVGEAETGGAQFILQIPVQNAKKQKCPN